MTRVNVVPVETIHTKQLHGEYVELPHVFGHTSRMIAAGRTAPVAKVPERYTMGPGHICFFMDKLGYVFTRYEQVSDELRRRGFNLKPRDLRLEFGHIPMQYWKRYDPDAEAMRENQKRIDQRLAERAIRKVTGERYPDK